MATGVPITAAALFETTLVMMAINSIRNESTHAGETPDVRYRNTWARYSAPPVFINADPSASEATIIMMTCVLSAWLACCQFMQPVPINTIQPKIALMAMGMIPKAARATIITMINKARGALEVCGKSAVLSRTSSSPPTFSVRIFSGLPCTRRTSLA